MMTLSQAAALQVKWKQRTYRTRCEHVILELECNEQGYWTGNYVCNLCGKCCGPRGFSHVASPKAPAPSMAHFPHSDY